MYNPKFVDLYFLYRGKGFSHEESVKKTNKDLNTVP